MSAYDKKERGFQRFSSLAGQTYLWNPWFKTVVIVSDYELEYNEKKQIFSKEQ
jgi:hypothetical protein